MTPYSFGQKLAAENAFIAAKPQPAKPQPAKSIGTPTITPLTRPQTFPKTPPSTKANQLPPVFQHPSGALQLGRINYTGASPAVRQTMIGPRPVEGATSQQTVTPARPVSPGIDSGPGTLRISQHGGGSTQYAPAASGPLRSNQYNLSNPTPTESGNVNSRGENLNMGARAELLNPAAPPTVPTPAHYNSDRDFDNILRWNDVKDTASFAQEAGAALPAGTNPQTIIAKACNSNPDGCTPATLARWLNAERGLHAGYGKQMAELPNAGDIVNDRAPKPTITPPALPPLNLNKVVMIPPGYLGIGKRTMGDFTDLRGDIGGFGDPYRTTRNYSDAAPPHDYRLTRGGDPMNNNHWTDTGIYSDARESPTPFFSLDSANKPTFPLADEAKEFGRHIGLGKELGGGDVNSYLDKIRDINNNPDATYSQKVRSNFARPVGTALQFGREAGGMLRENLEQAARANSAPGLGGAGFEGFSPY